MQKGAIKNGGSTTLHSKAKGGKRIGLDFKKTLFLGFSNFSKVFKRLCVLEHSRENSLLDLDLDGVFIPHFASQKSKTVFYFTSPFSSLQYPLSQDTESYGRCEVVLDRLPWYNVTKCLLEAISFLVQY